MAKSITPDITAREAAKNALKEIKKNGALLKVYNRIRDEHRAINGSDIIGRYNIGKEVNRLLNDESKYGSSAVAKMADALMLSDSDLYRWKDMASTWTPEEIKELATAETASGNTLTVSHLTALAGLPDAKLREKLLAQWYKEPMSARELATIIQSRTGTRNNNPNGRKVMIRSPLSGSVQMLKLSEKWLNYAVAVEQMVFEPLDKMADEFASDELAQYLRDLRDTSEQVRDAADECVAKIDAARRNVQAVLLRQRAG